MIGMYSLCYKEAELELLNLSRFYGLVSKIAVVVGPAIGISKDPDDATVAALRKFPDPEKKISVISGIWKSKNEMCKKAMEVLLPSSKLILQVDADEYWPKGTFNEVIGKLRGGMDWVEIPHFIFWKNHMTVCTVNGSPHYFVPSRAFRVIPGKEIRHIPPLIYNADNTRYSGPHCALDARFPIWHFAWTGEQRMVNKTAYHRLNGSKMFTMDDFRKSGVGSTVRIGDNNVLLSTYKGAPIDADLVGFFK